ncbi:NAD(P)-binding protein [Corynascus novoguineensis]|uniref:NAD(P)-binding protein n=1 Tax=Corynascus novoguineensis TaxID=1126955 RepID=A0AAN7HK53_9PEZI|nr:NAD(P)-binding protein [Corynascus novoguineensis]
MASPTVALVTGGNNGLGYEIVKALLESERPYHILMGSRSVEKAQQAISKLREEVPKASDKIDVVQVDVTSDESIEKAFEQVKANIGHIDVLVNNAGGTFDPAYLAGKVSLRSCFTDAYNLNVAGTHVLTHTFVPLLLKSANPRLVFVTGLSHITKAAESYFPTPPLPAGWPKPVGFETIGYRCSKTALNALMLDWNHKLKADGVKVWSVQPGVLVTDLGGLRDKIPAMGGKHPSVGGQLIRSVVEGAKDADVGKIVGQNGIEPW